MQFFSGSAPLVPTVIVNKQQNDLADENEPFRKPSPVENTQQRTDRILILFHTTVKLQLINDTLELFYIPNAQAILSIGLQSGAVSIQTISLKGIA